jgi:leucyl/phenylalanyl-tRNA--protein transferase
VKLALPWLGPEADAPFPPVGRALARPNGLLAAGGGLEPERLLRAYRLGIFPWYSAGEPVLWWSPDPRCVFHTAAMHVPRRLRAWLRNCPWTIGADRDFEGVIDACAEPRAEGEGTWITAEMRAAYVALHRLGHAHSIEVRQGPMLAGALYGVVLGRMFYAESMVSRLPGGSKLALLALARALAGWGFPLIDAQVSSAHLHTLGAVLMPRGEFLARATELGAAPFPSGSWAERFPTVTPSELTGA